MSSGYRQALQSLTGASAGAYGYTLVVWSGGAALFHLEGAPDVIDAALFLGGSVAAFLLLELAATHGFRESAGGSGQAQLELQLAGSLHFVSAGLGLGAAALVGAIVDGRLAWPIGGFSLTAAYFATAAAQLALVRRQMNRRAR